MDQDENQKSDNTKRRLSIDKAAFILLRIKRVFKKRSQSQHIEKKFVFKILTNYIQLKILECLIKKKIVWLILKLKQFECKSRKVSLNNTVTSFGRVK